MTRASSRLLGSWPITFLNVSRPTSGSVIPASVYFPMSAGIPYRSSNASRHEAAPAPPLEISVPSTSNRTAMSRFDTCTDAPSRRGGLEGASGAGRSGR